MSSWGNKHSQRSQRSQHTFINDAVVCAIALEEDLYIDEWIKYHVALGFSHIYIYDNGGTLKDKKSDRVTVIPFPGETKMLQSRDMFTLQYKNKHKWCAFIDIDEFIVLKKHNNIMEFLNEYDYDSIALNWLMFGTSNEKEYRDEPVTKRFRYCSTDINKHYKCISKLKSINIHISPHKPLIKGNIYDTNRKVITDIFNPDGDYNIACIHHYWTKSEDEYKNKIQRRTPDETRMRSIDLDIHSKNNDVYNSDAWDFFKLTI